MFKGLSVSTGRAYFHCTDSHREDWQDLTGFMNGTHTYTHTHTHTHTHAHTHTHTYTYTRSYSAGKHIKSSTNMHSKQALSPMHKLCQFLWILNAKKPEPK